MSQNSKLNKFDSEVNRGKNVILVSNQSERIEAIGEVIMRKIGSRFSKDKAIVIYEETI